ncbi:hypothetical protein PV04_10253 [Phialophora macrospora]|uniref:Heterokaryon incompatibility domain-containing protein n=1 Tax=Phialophora macrospora TaxID=1851006 RepID=A0A0D2F656_9EURO|nr:hypothetical protein PV04_10253 [Phialophora macrospora]
MSEQAESGCHLCTILLDGLTKPSVVDANVKPKTNKTRQRVQDIPPEVQLFVEIVRWWHSDYEQPFHGLFLYFREHETGDLTEIADQFFSIADPAPERPIPSRTTNSLASLAWIEKQMSVCRGNHDERGSQNLLTQRLGRQLPKRLLDLSDCVENATVRLIDGKSIPHSTLYTTLSHRWGAEEQLLLKSDTQAGLYSGFPLSVVPILYRDVMSLIRRLGYRYLWIDTLCLKQDDNLELEQQAPLMHLVYSMSELNVSASRSLHDESLYYQRNPLLFTDLAIPTDWTCFPEKRLFILRREHADPLAGEPILSRGWVFQERLLAPRVLHFGGKQLVWECRNTTEAELTGHHQTNKYGLQTKLLFMFSEKHNKPRSLVNFWVKMVEQFSETVTSLEKDRLFAIAGLAAIMDRLCWDRIDIDRGVFCWDGNIPCSRPNEVVRRYFAGIWRYNFAWQLAWYADGTKNGVTTPARPQLYRAPTWSWASVNGPVRFLPDCLFDAAPNVRELVRAETHTSTELDLRSMYGPTQTEAAGNLLVWCNLCEAEYFLNRPACEPILCYSCQTD